MSHPANGSEKPKKALGFYEPVVRWDFGAFFPAVSWSFLRAFRLFRAAGGHEEVAEVMEAPGPSASTRFIALGCVSKCGGGGGWFGGGGPKTAGVSFLVPT